MADRKPIPKKMRFEVFKRDGFTCQYCGAKPPDVVLHVDHIVPVADGGGNEMDNLVTACQECNLGKGARLLDDDAVAHAVRARKEEYEERKEQLLEMYEWNLELIRLADEEIDALNDVIEQLTGYIMDDNAERKARNLIKSFGFAEVMASARIAFSKYRSGTDGEWNQAFRKIGGICYNRANPRCTLCVEGDGDNDGVVCKPHGGALMGIESAKACVFYKPWFGGDAE